MQIAVGGCLAQKDKDVILSRAPWVDVVFGTHNIGSLPVLLERARIQHEAQVEIKEALETFPSNLPNSSGVGLCGLGVHQRGLQQHLHLLHRPQRCAVVRPTAGQARSWPRSKALVAEGVQEVTLLGQNVNAYGVEFGDRQAFAKLLRACGEIDGLERFASPLPIQKTSQTTSSRRWLRRLM